MPSFEKTKSGDVFYDHNGRGAVRRYDVIEVDRAARRARVTVGYVGAHDHVTRWMIETEFTALRRSPPRPVESASSSS